MQALLTCHDFFILFSNLIIPPAMIGWAFGPKQLALLPAKRDHRVGLLHFPVARDDPLCLPRCT